MNPHNPSGYPYAPPVKPPRPAWQKPVLIGVIVLLVVCFGLAALGALLPSATSTASLPTATASVVAVQVGGQAVGQAGLQPAPSSSPSSIAAPVVVPTTAAPAPTPSATPPKVTPKPTPTPTHKPTPPPTKKPTPSTCGAPANPWGLNLCGHGHTMTASQLPSGVCNYFHCIGNFSNGHGLMVECNDHTYSMSGGISGACSSHDGEGPLVYKP